MKTDSSESLETLYQAYLSGNINDKDRETVELYILENPEMAEQLEVDLVIKTHLPKIKEASTADASGFDWRKFWYIPLFSAGFGAATMALMALLSINNKIYNLPVQPVSNVIYFETLKSGDKPLKTIQLPAVSEPGNVAFFITPEPGAKGPFSVEINHLTTSKAITYQTNIPLSNIGDVIITIDKTTLLNGDYKIIMVDQRLQQQTTILFSVTSQGS